MLKKNRNEVEAVLNDLEQFCSIESISRDEGMQTNFAFEPLNDYFKHISWGAKPEAALSELIHYLLNEVYNFNSVPEVNYDNKFVDFLVYERGISANPLLLELKPLFCISTNKSRDRIKKETLAWEQHKIQIQNYLKNKSVEYVVLTNLAQAFLFNRDSVLDFKPIAEFPFTDILRQYLDNENLWDLIRRQEDSIVKPELDNEFYNSLTEWFKELEYVNFLPSPRFTKSELSVLLLNKIIFIKTLEDHGLIDYKHLQEVYQRAVLFWKPKGEEEIFNAYFRETEHFFERYYNTELFKTNIWQYIDKRESNLVTFRKKFEKILGLDLYSSTFKKGMLFYNYRQINEDVFGKAYETWLVKNRKDEGVYYTPTMLTEYMTKTIVDSLFADKTKEIMDYLDKSDFIGAQTTFDAMKKIRISDPTSGSGSFLIKVLRRIYEYYKKLQKKVQWVDSSAFNSIDVMPSFIEKYREFQIGNFLDEESELKLISAIIINHIFAADRDEKALETAKTNLWKEAVKLNHRIYNYLKITKDKSHILPNLEMNFIRGDSLVELTQDKQIEIITEKYKAEICRLHEIRNSYLSDPFNVEIIEEAKEIKGIIRQSLSAEFPEFKNALFYCLEYFFCYFDANGEPYPEEIRGFDGIVSNPPWEAVKPVRKEFAEQNKYDMDILHFNKWFNKQLKDDAHFTKRWDDYTGFYSRYKDFLYDKYKYQSKGDPNYYKFFVERDLQLLKDKGILHILIPSGFQTDQGSDLLRKLLIQENTLSEIYSFENKGYYEEGEKYKTKLFPDVHPQYKFSMVQVVKKKSELEDRAFNAKFYMHSPEDIENSETIKYNLNMIKQFSPENFSIMEFRSMKDYEICAKILGESKFLKDTGIVFRSEFHMTNDAGLYHTLDEIKDKKAEYYPLYEGKMIHQYITNGHEKRYFLKDSVRNILLAKELGRIKRKCELSAEDFDKIDNKENITLDYQTYRFAYRAIASSTNERTLISSILPKNVFIGHSMNHLVNVFNRIEDYRIKQSFLDPKEILLLMAFSNSLVLNYYIRNKVSANLTMNFVYELPIAEPDKNQKLKLAEKAFSLLYRKSMGSDFEGLKKETGIEPDMSSDLIELRASLEKDVAGLYGLDKADMEHICSSFVYGKGDSREELDKTIKTTLEMM